MIVTRRRRKPFPWKRLILPVIALALVFFAFIWTPSRTVITNGPMGPIAQKVGAAYDTVAVPFHFAAQNQTITDLRHQIVLLNKQIADAQAATTAKDNQLKSLQAQITQAQAEEAQSRSGPAVKPIAQSASTTVASTSGTPALGAQAGTGTYVHGDLSAGATPDMRRTAQYWANMEPANAAKVVQKLPVEYVARVLSLMSADAAGSILDALPATFAAALTQEDPGLRR